MSEPRRIAILGCTGSIGRQTLEVVRMHPDELRVTGLAANRDVGGLLELSQEFPEASLVLFDPQAASELAQKASAPVAAHMEGLVSLATSDAVDIVVVSVAGMIGLEPTIAALKAGKQVALASKEVLVAGGAVVMPLAREGQLRPIDSEHSAIQQCLNGEKIEQVERIFLTSSGGPFRGWTRDQMASVTPEQALRHPTWRMGGKITIDSATLMNKGLELIEACWLFDMPPERIEVIVHPQSVIHSMVKFADGSVLGQMGHPDMRLPIQYAILGPERVPSPARDWHPTHTPQLTFESVDVENLPCPDFAREAFRRGGVVPTVLNAVNEEAVHAFLRGDVPFLTIFDAAEDALEWAPNLEPTLPNILEADREARERFNASVREGVYSFSDS